MSSISSLWSDLVESLVPAVVFADDEPAEETPAEETPEEPAAEEPEAEEETEAEEPAEEEGEEEEEEDEEEPEDVLPELQEKAATEGPCKSFKHHFDECVERVTAAQQEEGYAEKEYKEDCIEEFFHLKHCIDEQVAPVLFNKLR